eukprot:6194080-Pleurochrysis_carterae.AAC.1
MHLQVRGLKSCTRLEERGGRVYCKVRGRRLVSALGRGGQERRELASLRAHAFTPSGHGRVVEKVILFLLSDCRLSSQLAAGCQPSPT